MSSQNLKQYLTTLKTSIDKNTEDLNAIKYGIQDTTNLKTNYSNFVLSYNANELAQNQKLDELIKSLEDLKVRVDSVEKEIKF